MNCPLCESFLIQKIDKSFYDCSMCAGIVKDESYYVSQEQEKLVYEQHVNDVNDEKYRAFTAPISNYILKHFYPQHKGLDFGSGTGPVISKVLEENDYNLIEKYDPYFCPNPNAFKKKYDFIFSCEVVEHFNNPEKEYNLLSRLLNKNGFLLIMTLSFSADEDFENWLYKNDPTHVFIHRLETFEYIAKQFGFDLIHSSKRFFVLKKK